MIDRTHPLSMSRQAQLLDISRGAVYYLPKPTSASDLQIMHAMDRLHLDFPFMGSRQLCRALRRQGGNPPLEPRGLEVEFFPKEEVLHEKVKIYG